MYCERLSHSCDQPRKSCGMAIPGVRLIWADAVEFPPIRRLNGLLVLPPGLGFCTVTVTAPVCPVATEMVAVRDEYDPYADEMALPFTRTIAPGTKPWPVNVTKLSIPAVRRLGVAEFTTGTGFRSKSV